MSPNHPRSYFLRLVWAFSLVVVLAFGMATWLVVTVGHRQIRNYACQQLLLRAQLAMDQVDRTLDDQARRLESWAEIEILDEVLLGDPNYRVENLILDLQSGAADSYEKILVLDRDYNIVASTEIDAVGQHWGGSLGYIRSDHHAELHVGLERPAGGTAPPDLLLAHPIRLEFAIGIVGWLVAELNWELVDAGLAVPASIQDPAAGGPRLLLLSEHGEIIGGTGAAIDDIKDLIGFGQSIVDPATVADSLERDSPYLAAHSVSANGLSASGGGLWVLAVWPKSEAYASIGPFTNAVVGSLLIGLVLSLGASYVIAGYFTREIRSLLVATDRLAAGDLAFRVEERRDDELGRLARSFNDMAARMAKNRDARESALARWRSLAEYAPDLILTTDRTGKIVYANRAVQGEQPADLIGIDALYLFPEDGRVQLQSGLDRVFHRREAVSMELPGIAKGGIPSWSHVRIGPVLREGEAVAATLISTDITERKLLEQESLNVSERERKRIGRDLHDGVGQVMTGVAMFARSLRLKLQNRSVPEAGDAEKIERLMNEAVQQTRALAKGLFPMEIEAAGLRGALEDLLGSLETMNDVTGEVVGIQAFPGMEAQSAMHLYRLVQEAVSNALRHGRADHIRIEMFQRGGVCGLNIVDNGKGIRESRGTGMGLHLMNYRAQIVGGSLAVEPNPEGGTVVRFEMPCGGCGAGVEEGGA